MTTTRHTRPDNGPRFEPPFCPNSSCPFHLPQEQPWSFTRNGYYTRRSDSARFPRFRCLHCRQGFSSRTFSSDYWLRKRELLPKIAELSASGAGLRQIGRVLKLSHSTVSRHIARAGTARLGQRRCS